MRAMYSLIVGAAVFVMTLATQLVAQGPPSTPGSPQGPGGGRPPFPAQLRPPGDPALIKRGTGLYGVYCRVCHGADLRGGDQGGPNLLRSPVVLNDREGELIGPVIVNGQRAMPPIPLPADDVRAIAEYIHSVTATMQRQGGPPPGQAPKVNVLVGDASRGQAYFAAKCASCHSVTGDLRGIATRLADPVALQNHWLSAGGGLARGGPRGAQVVPRRDVMATITPATGAPIQGALVRLDDFYVVVRLANGVERSFARSADGPRVEVNDPYEPHRKLLPTYTDGDIHDVTAFLATLK